VAIVKPINKNERDFFIKFIFLILDRTNIMPQFQFA
jgi:hypothetical protein